MALALDDVDFETLQSEEVRTCVDHASILFFGENELQPVDSNELQPVDFKEIFELDKARGEIARLDGTGAKDVVVMGVRRQNAGSNGDPRALKIFTVANAAEIPEVRDEYLAQYSADPNCFRKDASTFGFFLNYASFEAEVFILQMASKAGADRIVSLLGSHQLVNLPLGGLADKKVVNAIELPRLDKYRHRSPSEWREGVGDLVEILEAIHQLHSLFIAKEDYPAELQAKISDDGGFHHPIHLDINPSQVMRDANKRLVLIDFGYGRILDEKIKRSTNFLGVRTELYPPPEQLRGLHESALDFRDYCQEVIDVYPVAIMLFQFLTGLEYASEVYAKTGVDEVPAAAVGKYREDHLEKVLKEISIDREFDRVREPLLAWLKAITETAWENRKRAILELLGKGEHGWKGEWNLAIRSADYLSRKVLGRNLKITLNEARLPGARRPWLHLCATPEADASVVPLADLVETALVQDGTNARTVPTSEVRWFARGVPRFDSAAESERYRRGIALRDKTAEMVNRPVVWRNCFRPWWPGSYRLYPTWHGLVAWDAAVDIEVIPGNCDLFVGIEGRGDDVLELGKELFLCDGMRGTMSLFAVHPEHGILLPVEARIERPNQYERGIRFGFPEAGSLEFMAGLFSLPLEVRIMGSFEEVLRKTRELHGAEVPSRTELTALQSLFWIAATAEDVPAEFLVVLGSNLEAIARKHALESLMNQDAVQLLRIALSGVESGYPLKAVALANYLLMAESHDAREAESSLLRELAGILNGHEGCPQLLVPHRFFLESILKRFPSRGLR